MVDPRVMFYDVVCLLWLCVCLFGLFYFVWCSTLFCICVVLFFDVYVFIDLQTMFIDLFMSFVFLHFVFILCLNVAAKFKKLGSIPWMFFSVNWFVLYSELMFLLEFGNDLEIPRATLPPRAFLISVDSCCAFIDCL